MKKLTLAVMAIAIVMISVAPAIQTAQAMPLPPASCSWAEELGWSSWGVNRMCLYDLQDNCCDPIGDPWYD